jgi:hypothetical protein
MKKDFLMFCSLMSDDSMALKIGQSSHKETKKDRAVQSCFSQTFWHPDVKNLNQKSTLGEVNLYST